MRAAAITALLAVVALAGERGKELTCEFGEGEAEAVAKVIARRLEFLRIEGVEVKALEDSASSSGSTGSSGSTRSAPSPSASGILSCGAS